MSLLNDCYVSYLNLDHRKDRLEHIQNELQKAGINAERTRGRLPEEFDSTDPRIQVMWNRTKGACGCHYGQVEIMKEALKQNKHAFIMEDDCVFCSDIHERLSIAEDFLKDKDWTALWLGGTYHANNPAWWHKPGHSIDLKQCKCTLGVDAEKTESKYMVRTYGCFSTHCYIINKNHIQRVLDFLEANVHLSMGIDWLMILMQPQVLTYAFVPGMVIQKDNMSDIGGGMTVFSGFKRLGNHWYQDKMSDFDYDNFTL
jgi:GR25 family glycosyltransferase involved in LPS biosynthesis